MADHDYVRLSPACHCGKPTPLKLGGRGRPPKYCEEHQKRSAKAAPESKECPACRGFFVPARSWQRYCTTVCKLRHTRGSKPADEVRSYECKQCASGFESAHWAPMYCGTNCKHAAWLARNPDYKASPKAPPQKLLSAYIAKHCDSCGVAGGQRRPWSQCAACIRSAQLLAGRIASKAFSEAKHKASARVVCCEECEDSFCPLYGSSNATLCAPCADNRAKAGKRKRNAMRRAVERMAEAESVDPFRVFDRDKWRCQLCKCKTPRSKRGTYDNDAPELDHIMPLAKGGAHTYANTQCACRKCNGLKSDKPMGQALLFG